MENDVQRLWDAIEADRKVTLANSAKLDSVLERFDEIHHELMGDGQPGMRQRLTKLEVEFQSCRMMHTAERNGDLRAVALSRSTRIAIWTVAITVVVNITSVLLHAFFSG